MSRRARNLRIIKLRWVARFGEPPPILTDPKLMLSILNSVVDRPAAPVRDLDGDAEPPLGINGAR
jgi:hypothetical protein